MFEGPGASLSSRQARSRTSQGLSSCDLLVRLSDHVDIVPVFADEGIKIGTLSRVLQDLKRQGRPEPADWSHRFRQLGHRPEGSKELEQLLALARSADCNAYRALEQSGALMPRLRKRIIDRLQKRARLSWTQRSQSEERSTSGLATRSGSGSTRATSISNVVNSDLLDRRGKIGAENGTESGHSIGNPIRSDRARSLTKQGSSPSEIPNPNIETHLHESEIQAGLLPRVQEQSFATVETSPSLQRPTRSLQAIDPESLQDLAGREGVLAMLADACSRQGARAPLLVGEHGSGKSLISIHLSRILNRPVFQLRAMDYESSEDLGLAFDEVILHDGVAIFDDLDRVAGDIPPDFLPALIQAWAKGSPSTLTLVSHESHSRLATWIPGILETLDTVVLAPMQRHFVSEAVKASAPSITQRHGVQLSCTAHLSELARLADRYLTTLAMPGRALDLLDLACARTIRMNQEEVTPSCFVDIVCERTGLPRSQVEGRGEQELLDLGRSLSQRVVGHRHAIDTLSSLVRRNRAGFASTRPIATALLLGPSGVGKTELAKAIAQSLFGGNNESISQNYDALLRLDMSEFSEPHSVARIVGAPPGYVGHEQGGALSEPMLNRPHCVVLLDEIEKAHRDVHQLLLQVLDEGHLSDGRGRTIEFRHCVLIMTSNLGSEQILQNKPTSSNEDIFALARKAFPIELWNRIEAPLVLSALSTSELRTICQRMVAQSSQRILKERGIRYQLDDSAYDYILRRSGSDPALGARPIRHILSLEVEALVADAILCGQVRAGSCLTITEQRRRLAIC